MPDVIEAAIASIAQFPRSMKPRLVKAMLAHQGEEFDHGERLCATSSHLWRSVPGGMGSHDAGNDLVLKNVACTSGPDSEKEEINR